VFVLVGHRVRLHVWSAGIIEPQPLTVHFFEPAVRPRCIMLQREQARAMIQQLLGDAHRAVSQSAVMADKSQQMLSGARAVVASVQERTAHAVNRSKRVLAPRMV
jgi:hypothetical protein